LLLTPEGRAVNQQLTKQSQLQFYSYFNFHLGLRRNFFFSPKNILLENIEFNISKKPTITGVWFITFLKILFIVLISLCFTLY
jgi:hypothetical protein